MKRQRLKAISPKKAKANSLYAKTKRKIWRDLCESQGRSIKDGPLCQRCNKRPATDPHHKAGRSGVLLWHENLLCWVCNQCHLGKDGIHPNPAKSRKEGWIVDLTREEYQNIEAEERPKLWY